MSQAFDITSDNLHTVLARGGIELPLDQCDKMFDKLVDEGTLNLVLIENAILMADDLDEQTELALQTMGEQLQAGGELDKIRAMLYLDGLGHETPQETKSPSKGGRL